jgi:hypothetical protein
LTKLFKAREAGDSGINAFLLSHPLSPAPRALQVCWVDDPGVPLRSTPGFTLSPATAGWLDFVGELLFVQASPVRPFHPAGFKRSIPAPEDTLSFSSSSLAAQVAHAFY